VSLYLLIDLAAVAVPLIFSFHPRIAFHREWRSFLPAILLAAIPYLIWDQFFTDASIWGFNPAYHGTILVADLPIEEILFFVCIPYACLFTYYSITKLTSVALPTRLLQPVYGLLFLLFGLMVAVTHDLWYTMVNGAFAGVILAATYFFRRDLLLRFIPVYLVTLLPFFLVNGVLTGMAIDGEVVWYNNAENLGIRAITIPIEDFVYAFSMLLLNTLLFESFRGKHTSLGSTPTMGSK
jgi:lycopene cyclase domain-containing protein